jgi:hypothetical protein
MNIFILELSEVVMHLLGGGRAEILMPNDRPSNNWWNMIAVVRDATKIISVRILLSRKAED